MKVSAEEPGVSAVVGSAGGSGVKVHCLFLDLCSYWCVWDVSGLIARVKASPGVELTRRHCTVGFWAVESEERLGLDGKKSSLGNVA